MAAEAFAASIAAGVAGVAALIAEVLGVAQVPIVYTDNEAVSKLALDAAALKRALHIMRRIAWLQERVATGDIIVKHIPGTTMSADMNTKVPLFADFARFMAFLYGEQGRP